MEKSIKGKIEEKNDISADNHSIANEQLIDNCQSSENNQNNQNNMKLFNKNFILMLQGSVVSLFGSVLYSIAIGYYVYTKTNSEALMGIFSSISFFITMILSPITGALADRISRKKIIVGMDAFRGVAMIIIGVLCLYDMLNIPLLTVFTVVVAMSTVMFRPASSTVMIDIVPKEEFVRATSISSSFQTVIDLISKGISGFLLVYFGVAQLIIFNGISFLISAISEYFIDIPKTPKQGSKISVGIIFKDIIEGFKTMINTKGLNVLFPMAILINLCASGMMSLFLVFTTEKGFSLEQYGLLMSVQSLGMFIGAMIVSVVKIPQSKRHLVMSLSFLISFPSALLAYLATNYYLVISCMALNAMLSAIANMLLSSSQMILMPAENRAACMGFLTASAVGGMAISTLAYGILAEFFPISRVASVGLLIALIPLLIMITNKDLKKTMSGE